MAMESLPHLKDIELIRLAKEIPHDRYTELNAALGFSNTEGGNILASNQSKYTDAIEQMLTKWNIGQIDPSQSRIILSQKLIEIGISKPGSKLSNGEYLQSQDERRNQKALSVSSESAMATQEDIPDELLRELAEDIETGEQMEALGRTLGFNTAAINRYAETNRLEGRVTSKGTRDMLFDWRQKVESSNQHLRLKQALIDAELIMLAEIYLKKMLATQDTYTKKISESLTVRKCRTILEDKYSNQLCKIQMRPWDKDDYAEFKEMHTVVTVVKKDAKGKDIKEKEILQGSVGKIFSTKVNGRFPSRILISAPAGRGKTTAVAKMAHDWVNREEGSGLEDLPLLFVVKFRNTSQSTSIGEAIISQLLSDVKDLTPEGLEEFIRQHQGICHIVLDGLDEYAGISSSSNIMNILRWEMFQQCRVLVTTRPHLVNDFSQGDLPRVYTKMEIEGFSKENACDYIDRFFSSRIQKPMKADGLKFYLDTNPLIEELVKTPLFCLMVCHLWSVDRLDSKTSTQTELLDKVNVFLSHHANKRTEGLFTPETLDAVIHKLGEVALTGLLADSKKLVFTPRDFQKIPSVLDKACELGIVSKKTVSSEHIPKPNETYSTTIEFYHKLAQEHAAGKFLAHKTSRFKLYWKISKLDQVLRKIKRNVGDYENLLRFAAGTKNRLCIRIMETLLTNSYLSESERYRILLDCSSESGFSDGNVSSLVRRCVTSKNMLLQSPTVYTVVGMRNLPSELKQEVVSVQFEQSFMATTVTDGLWTCLKSFPMLTDLSISDSSIDFRQSPPELPSIKSLSVKGVTSQCYKGLISTLPCLTDIVDIDTTIDDAEGDIAYISASLRRIGVQKLKRIILRNSPSSFPSQKSPFWSETEGGLRLLFDKNDTDMNMIILHNARHSKIEVLDLFAFFASLAQLKLEFLDGWSFNFETTFGVKMTKCQLSPEMTTRMWSCLGSFTSLNHLTILNSCLCFPPSPPELPSIRSLSVEGVTSQCYKGLISTLTGLVDIVYIDITIDDAERDIAFITASLCRTGGQKLTHIDLSNPYSEKSHVSSETMRGLCALIVEHTKNLNTFYLRRVKCRDEGDLVFLIECCRYVKTMERVEFWECGTMWMGKVASYLERLDTKSPNDLPVYISYDDNKHANKFSIPHIER